VQLAREAVNAISDRLGLSRALTEDIRLAVTEACTNVVRHAYDGPGGTLTVEVDPFEAGLRIEVRDSGCGERARPTAESAGFGIPLIDALALRHEIELAKSGGRTVRMFFVPRTGRFTPS
jgi:serine/threonine-protein kinase RsbW